MMKQCYNKTTKPCSKWNSRFIKYVWSHARTSITFLMHSKIICIDCPTLWSPPNIQACCWNLWPETNCSLFNTVYSSELRAYILLLSITTKYNNKIYAHNFGEYTVCIELPFVSGQEFQQLLIIINLFLHDIMHDAVNIKTKITEICKISSGVHN